MGYAVVTLHGTGSFTYRECGLITANKKAPIELRLAELGEGLASVLSEYAVTEAAVEDIFVGDNVRSAFVLGQARGMVLYLLGGSSVPVTSYAPTKVKKYVTGRGRAPKAQVRRSVSLLANLGSEPAEDAADALAIALCHAMHLKVMMRPSGKELR